MSDTAHDFNSKIEEITQEIERHRIGQLAMSVKNQVAEIPDPNETKSSEAGQSILDWNWTENAIYNNNSNDRQI